MADDRHTFLLGIVHQLLDLVLDLDGELALLPSGTTAAAATATAAAATAAAATTWRLVVRVYGGFVVR
ncbi:MAG: hypothetical protein ACRDXB_23130, partial [Actinomycetes bacterium]